MKEDIEKIIKTAKDNEYAALDMVIAANSMMVEELKAKLQENGGSISFTEPFSNPYMVGCGTEVFELKVTKVYLDEEEEIKIDGQIVYGDDTIYTFNIDEFVLCQMFHILILI